MLNCSVFGCYLCIKVVLALQSQFMFSTVQMLHRHVSRISSSPNTSCPKVEPINTSLLKHGIFILI